MKHFGPPAFSWAGYATKWRQLTPLAEANTIGGRSWFNSPVTGTNVSAGIQWLDGCGVRSGGERSPPRLEKFQGISVFRASASCSHSNDNTGRCRESYPSICRFQPLRCAIEVAYIIASVKAITVRFLVWENTTRKEPHPLELKSEVTTEFACNGISRRLHKERYCRIEVTGELACM